MSLSDSEIESRLSNLVAAGAGVFDATDVDGNQRELAADALRIALQALATQDRTEHATIEIRGATINGLLSLDDTTIPYDLRFSHCKFLDGISAARSNIRQLEFVAVEFKAPPAPATGLAALTPDDITLKSGGVATLTASCGGDDDTRSLDAPVIPDTGVSTDVRHGSDTGFPVPRSAPSRGSSRLRKMLNYIIIGILASALSVSLWMAHKHTSLADPPTAAETPRVMIALTGAPAPRLRLYVDIRGDGCTSPSEVSVQAYGTGPDTTIRRVPRRLDVFIAGDDDEERTTRPLIIEDFIGRLPLDFAGINGRFLHNASATAKLHQAPQQGQPFFEVAFRARWLYDRSPGTCYLVLPQIDYKAGSLSYTVGAAGAPATGVLDVLMGASSLSDSSLVVRPVAEPLVCSLAPGPRESIALDELPTSPCPTLVIVNTPGSSSSFSALLWGALFGIAAAALIELALASIRGHHGKPDHGALSARERVD